MMRSLAFACSITALALFAGERMASAAEGPDPAKAIVEPEDWERRDFEGRWTLYVSSVEKNPREIKPWLQFLVQKKEFELIEAIAIYRLNESLLAAQALADADAPQWVRVKIWIVNHGSSHMYEGALLTLRTKRDTWASHWSSSIWRSK